MQTITINDYDKILTWSYTLAKSWIIEHLVTNGVNSVRKFERYKKTGKYLPKHFPRLPDKYFSLRGSWKGWPDFFGHPDQSKSFLNYDDASRIARFNEIRSCKQYRQWKNRPPNLPGRPELFFENHWKGWEEFLGKNYEKQKKGLLKLNISDVRIIKHQLQLGVPGTILAEQFAVSEMQISRIKRGENWNEVENENNISTD